MENLIEGFSTAFNENDLVEIHSKIEKTSELIFDETFGNIAFKMS